MASESARVTLVYEANGIAGYSSVPSREMPVCIIR